MMTRRFGTIASATLACAALATASPAATAARAYALPPGAPVSATFAAEVDGVAAPVEERDYVAQLQVALDDGPATVRLTFPSADEYEVSPLIDAVPVTRPAPDTMVLTLDAPGHYVVSRADRNPGRGNYTAPKLLLSVDGASADRPPAPSRRLTVPEGASTAEIQALIDASGESGGRMTVYVPPGRLHLTNTLFMRPRSRLHIDEGSRIKALEEPLTMALILIHEADGVRISGRGSIDGSGAEYVSVVPYERLAERDARRYYLMYAWASDDVRISGVTLQNAGGWTNFVSGSERWRMKNVRVIDYLNPSYGWFEGHDGIVFSSSRDMRFVDSIVHSGDDGLTVKHTNSSRFDVTEDIVFRNVVTYASGTSRGIAISDEFETGSTVRGLTYRDIDVVRSEIGFAIDGSADDSGRTFSGIRFDGVRFENVFERVFDVDAGGIDLSGVTLRNVSADRWGELASRFRSLEGASDVGRFTFDGVTIDGQRLRSREDLLPYVEFGTGVDDRYR